MNNTQIFINIITPLVFVVIGVLANRLGRKDGDKTPKINYFSVGTSVILMTLATIISDVHVDVNGNVQGNFGWLTIYILFVFVSIDIDRYSSWERTAQGRPTGRKHFWKGVLLPNTFGVGAFCLYRFMV